MIEQLLKDKIGLDVRSVGEPLVHNAIKRCLHESSYGDVEQYYNALLSSDAEFRRLVEAVIIPETWFFRDEKPFEVLKERANKGLLHNKQQSLKILSVPCSTGEEPYTIAMALNEAGVPVGNIQIDAIDLSSSAIDKAKQGVYRDNSFRSDNLTFRDKYFTKIDGGYQLDESIKKRVSFRQGNILQDDLFEESAPPYDVIFCRNLMIYFDSRDQVKTARRLYDLLKDDGVLFVGHAEANNNINSLFQSLRLRGSFSFVKKVKEANDPVFDDHLPQLSKSRESLLSIQRKKRMLNRSAPADAERRPFARFLKAERPGHVLSLPEKELIQKARSLADEGNLEAAEHLCHEILLGYSDADVFYLLGVIYEASDRYDQAESMFRKAIYLMPDHVEALVHLALHLERNGKNKEAASLRRRAARDE